MRKRNLILLAAILWLAPAVGSQTTRLSLAGSWQFRLDPNNIGHDERWFDAKISGDTIYLPGSTDQAGYGNKTETPPGFRPIVQVIDDFHRAHKLGAVFEARVGSGKLLAVSLDLRTNLGERPAARQLLYSLLRYAASDRFDPQQTLSLAVVEKLLTGSGPGN
jgi:hypothetical protein